jgi:hypothetical protein
MFVLATGTFTDPSKLGPYLNEEIAQSGLAPIW